MVDDGIYYFSSYRAECDVMSWEKIIKAPPPRPPSNKDIPTVSKYSSPRWLNVTSKGEHDRYDRTIGPKVTDIKINPLYPVDAFIVDAKTFKRYEDLSSMTSEERQNHAIISGSRRKRNAKGSGTTVQDINRLLKQFVQTKKMMKSLTKGGKRKAMGLDRNLFPM